VVPGWRTHLPTAWNSSGFIHLTLVTMLLKKILIIDAVALAIWAHVQPIHIQNNTWNSCFTFSPAQIAAANLSSILVNNIEIATNFERTNWATGSITEDHFYNAPPVNTSTPPGTLLAVEEVTDTKLYKLAPGLALSRILFVSETLNGTAVPASAYILWPWQAKTFRNSPLDISDIPVVGWGHGTSGVHGECAPSHIRNLWYQYSAPYTLALQGYAVVAPDYAGLGINRTAEGQFIPHQYTANPAGANDIFFAIEAAQSAFPELSKHFVTMGHCRETAYTASPRVLGHSCWQPYHQHHYPDAIQSVKPDSCNPHCGKPSINLSDILAQRHAH
jgi:hypothetical protein